MRCKSHVMSDHNIVNLAFPWGIRSQVIRCFPAFRMQQAQVNKNPTDWVLHMAVQKLGLSWIVFHFGQHVLLRCVWTASKTDHFLPLLVKNCVFHSNSKCTVWTEHRLTRVLQSDYTISVQSNLDLTTLCNMRTHLIFPVNLHPIRQAHVLRSCW